MNNFSNRGISTMLGLIIIIAVAILATGGVLTWQNGWLARLMPQKSVACTQEVKLCPDGSAVGRTGPNCEFALCPTLKADETVNWKTYISDKAGFSFKYPIDAIINDYGFKSVSAPRLGISISEQKMDGLPNEAPVSAGKKDAQERQNALQFGKFGPDRAFVIKDSEKVVNLGEISAQDYVLLGAFEVCDMQFGRHLVFYKNGYEVEITWSLNMPRNSNGSVKGIDKYNKYFELNETSCNGYVWKENAGVVFYQDLVSGNAPPEFQNWYDSFGQMLSTFKFTNSATGDIKTGEITIDYQAIKTLQTSIDQGHQPWRLDPESVVRAEILQYGFAQSDLTSLKITLRAASTGVNEYEINHNSKVYVIRVIQVVPGQGQVWVISSIGLK